MKNCIINTQDRIIVQHLSELGYICHSTITSKKVSAPINKHADVLYLKTGDKSIIISDCQKSNIDLLKKSGYVVSFIENLKPGYETESYLNFIINDNYIIQNPKTALDCSFLSQRQIIAVNQGYTRCSTICINESAYMTDDGSIYKALKNNNLDCLLLKKGEVKLDGYGYGFIGGASIMLRGENLLFFCGDFENKYDKDNITAFLLNYNINPYYIKNKQLHDIGSSVVL